MQAIQEAMFVFDNLIMSDDKSQTLMRSVDTEDLVLALKGTDVLADKISCVKPRSCQYSR